MLYAEVAVNSTFPHRQTFSYRVPPGIDARVGHAAYVPFGRQTLQGVIVELHTTPVFSEPEKIRPIRSLIGEQPLLDADRLALALWIANYYVAPVFDAIALFLPPGFERRPEVIVRPLVDDGEVPGLDVTARQRQILAALFDGSGRTIDELRARLSSAGFDAAITQLERASLIAREYRLARPSVAARTIEMVNLAAPMEDALGLIAASEPPKPSRRAAVLDRLIGKRHISSDEASRLAGSRANLERLTRASQIRSDRDGHAVELAISVDEARSEIARLTRTARASQSHAVVKALAASGRRTLAEVRDDAKAATATLRWLATIGVVEIAEIAVERDPLAASNVARVAPAVLLAAQTRAAEAIVDALSVRRHETFLLHGVTGSGKTEVYLHALDRCAALGRRAIVLVPEIALTPQAVRRFRERFERVAVIHSGLTDGELFDQWNGIAAGRYDVVVGARSAIFAPQPDLGLIVIDEEQEWTYKQQSPPPRYHARDVAIELARRIGAVVVLGSATPDVASYERAARRDYTRLSLPERIRPVTDDAGQTRLEASWAMPRIDVVDLRVELHNGNRSMFGEELQRAMTQALAAKEQVILLLNRRGLAGHVQCRDCGFVPECGGCNVSLTYHRQFDRLVCHQCNRRWRLPVACRQCGSPRVRLVGVGTEKVEAEAARMFPHARTLRWDRDASRTRGAHDRILASFLAHEADILVGTQMLAKGLDMPDVTVVGVVNADVGLHLPEFRSGERTFQLLTQVAGRAGRGARNGRAIIQTYTPDHYAIDAASRYDYDGFAAAELESRRLAAYPPFARLVRLTIAHPNEKFAREDAHRIQRALTHRRAEIGSDAEVIGPSQAYVPRVRGRWRWQLLLRGRDPGELVRGFVLPPNWAVDVDPGSLL